MEKAKISQNFPVLITQNKLKCLHVNTIFYYDTAKKSHRGHRDCSLAEQYVNTVK